MQVHYASPNYHQLFVKASCFNGWGMAVVNELKHPTSERNLGSCKQTLIWALSLTTVCWSHLNAAPAECSQGPGSPPCVIISGCQHCANINLPHTANWIKIPPSEINCAFPVIISSCYQVWAGTEACEPVTWQECKLVPKDVKFIVPEITCSDKQEIWYHEPEKNSGVPRTMSWHCWHWDLILIGTRMTNTFNCEGKKTSHCRSVTRPDCKQITWNECR